MLDRLNHLDLRATETDEHPHAALAEGEDHMDDHGVVVSCPGTDGQRPIHAASTPHARSGFMKIMRR